MSQTFSGVNVFVTIGGVSYTPDDLNLVRMEVTDSDEGDSDVELVCLDNEFKIADSSSIKVGVAISVKWGYTNGRTSQERADYIMMKPSTHYTKDGVQTTLKAYTKSATLAARRPQKVYGATSVRQIVSEIANRSGLTLNIVGGNEKLTAFSMANWTDRQTLRILADRYGYQLSFNSDTITFAPIDYGAAPTIELVYGNGESGNILSAELNVDARHPMGDSATTAMGIDTLTKTVKSEVAKDADKTVAISAENGHSWLSSAAQTVSTSLPDLQSFMPSAGGDSTPPPDVMSYITSPDDKNLLSMATGEKLKKQKKKGELTIESVGVVDGICRKIIHVTGLAKRDSGNWYAQEVRHAISKDGYSTHWELSRHGNNTQGGEPNKSPLNNATPPGSTPAATVSIIAVDAETGKVTP